MITLASTNIQNVPVCPSTKNEDTSNSDINTGLMIDSKLHSHVPTDSYVLRCVEVNNELKLLID